ncbi:carboxypeptidase-like regulatory domain-containing protein [Myxococcus sp. K15C18031901]|nr:carboxypeptidase-like regulatory domain-containing protein [Myxococcus dinghuensis]
MVDVVVSARAPGSDRQWMAVTDAKGDYRLQDVPPGHYTLHWEKEVYEPHVLSDVQLRPGRNLRIQTRLYTRFRYPPRVELFTDSRVVDMSSSSTGIRVEANFIRRVPLR